MKIWKRNAIVATVLVLLCAGVYINWSYNQKEAVDLTQTLNAEQVMSETTLDLTRDAALETVAVSAQEPTAADSFAQIRLSRQESRDSAVELLQQTMAYAEEGENAGAAADSLDKIVSSALAESQIESLVVAKGYADCVAYMGDEIISIAVSAPAEGLSASDVALISDIVTSQTAYDLDNLRIIEVKGG